MGSRRIAVAMMCLMSIGLMSCGKRVVYSEVRTLPKEGWHADSLLTYDIAIEDTAACYDVLLYVRHTQQYPYQNMWLFVGQDTIEFYLADQRGRWLGNGWGELREMPVIYQHNIRFGGGGDDRYTIQQAMRDTLLKGVQDVGITIVRSDGKE